VSLTSVNEKIADVVAKHDARGADEIVFLQPFEDVYLYSDYQDGKLVGGRIEYVRIFLAVAVFLLLIAMINFMNLATARSAQRACEIGIRKAIGGSQRSLIVQFLGESVLVALIAFGFAVGIVETLLHSQQPNQQTYRHRRTERRLPAGRAWRCAVSWVCWQAVTRRCTFFPQSTCGAAWHVPSAAERCNTEESSRRLPIRLSALLIYGVYYCVPANSVISAIKIGDWTTGTSCSFAQEGALKSQYVAIRDELLKLSGITNVTSASTSPLNINRTHRLLHGG